MLQRYSGTGKPKPWLRVSKRSGGDFPRLQVVGAMSDDHVSITDPLLAFLRSPGEMGKRIADYPWFGHVLGPAAAWPRSLKTAVSLILNSQHAMWIGWGPDATFLYNDAYLHVLGRAKHPAALGRPAAEVWSEIWDICGPLADKVFRNGEASFVEDVQLFMNRGDFLEETYYSFSYSPIRDETGAVGGLFCPSTDVTPKVVGARRLRSLSTLAANALAENTVAGASASVIATLGNDPDDIPFASLILVDGDSRPVSCENVGPVPERSWPIDDACSSGRPQRVRLEPTVGSSRGGGDQPIVDALVLPIIAGTEIQPLGALVVGLNPARPLDADYHAFLELVAANIATAFRNARAAEDDRHRAEMLADLDRAKTAFFSNVSHEFRTPLTLLLGPLDDMLNASESLPPATRELALLAHRNALRLQKLANTLLEFSRIEAGRLAGQFEPTDLSAFTADLASNFRSACERVGLELIVDCPSLDEQVYVDRAMWEKIVLNLLSNAFKFTLAGAIAVRVRRDTKHIELIVSDTGVGVEREQLPRLFERFHRIAGQASRTYEGSGIGLALVSELVNLHGGTIGAASQLGTGTTFTVRIPLGAAHLDPASIVTDGRGAGATTAVAEYLAEVEATIGGDMNVSPTVAGNSQRARVLLADDNPDLRRYVARVLSRAYDVVAVSDGAAALAAAREGGFDVVITDAMMPHVNGFELIAALRDDPHLRTMPVLMLSARAGEDSAVEGLSRGADDYLAKPFSADELVARVGAHVNAVRERRAKLADDLHGSAWFDAPAEQRIGATSFRVIADQLPFVVWLQDASGSISFLNDTACRITGLSRGRQSLTAAMWSACVHPDDRSDFIDSISDAVAVHGPYESEVRVRALQSGEAGYRWYLYRALPQTYDGVFRGWLGTATDVQAQKDVLARSRRIAQTLQEGLLPRELPQSTRMRIDAIYQAAEADALVGGDWYDAIVLPDGRTLLSVGDVTGHGIDASALAARLRHAIRDFALDVDDPSAVLTLANRVVQLEEPGTYATALVAFIDAAMRTLSYASAGHPPPVFADRGGVPARELPGGGITLGVEADAGAITHHVELAPGAVAAFYTDGMTEFAREPAVAEARLRDAVGTHFGNGDAENAAQLVRSTVLDGAATSDDAALLLVRFVGPTAIDDADIRVWQLPAIDPEAMRTCRREAVSFVRDSGADESVLCDAELTIGEILANALEHARGPITVTVDRRRETAVITVRDSGPGMPDAQATLPSDELAENGRGLFLIAALAHDVRITPVTGGGTEIRAVLSASRSPYTRLPERAADCRDDTT